MSYIRDDIYYCDRCGLRNDSRMPACLGCGAERSRGAMPVEPTRSLQASLPFDPSPFQRSQHAYTGQLRGQTPSYGGHDYAQMPQSATSPWSVPYTPRQPPVPHEDQTSTIKNLRRRIKNMQKGKKAESRAATPQTLIKPEDKTLQAQQRLPRPFDLTRTSLPSPTPGVKKEVFGKQPQSKNKSEKRQMPGRHGFEILAQHHVLWCYTHTHPKEHEQCTRKELVVYFEPLNIPVQTPVDYEPIPARKTPDTVWEAIRDLSHFVESLNEYLVWCPARDKFQLMILEDIENGDIKTGGGPRDAADFSEHFQHANCNAAAYYDNLQRLTKHCYLLFCQLLLEDMHKHDLELQTKNAFNRLLAPVAAICCYKRLCQARVERGEEEHLPISAKGLEMWVEFQKVVQTVNQEFDNSMNVSWKGSRILRSCIEASQYKDVSQSVMGLGFGPQLEGAHSIPRVIVQKIFTGKQELEQKPERQKQPDQQKNAELDRQNNMDIDTSNPAEPQDDGQQGSHPADGASGDKDIYEFLHQ